MNGVFVDTGAWFARFVPTEPYHTAVKAWLDASSQTLITTDQAAGGPAIRLTPLMVIDEHAR